MKPALLIALSVLCLAPLAMAATPAAQMLVASTPARNAEGIAAVDRISLSFAEQVELLSVTIIMPDESERDVFQTSYEPGAEKKKVKAFDFMLADALTGPGRYKISYLLTSKSIKSLNGFIDFAIMSEAPVTPADPQTSPEAF